MRPAVVLPTGAGKTVVFAHLIAAWLALNPGWRALVLAHRTELIEQAMAKLHDVAPGLRVGMVKAQRNDTLADAIVASVQTLRNEQRRKMLRNVGLIVVDECHHATAASYRAVLDYWPDALVVGFTATMTRSDDAALGDIWQDVVYMRTISEMINSDPPYLVRPRGIRVYVDTMDMSGVRMSKGDYRESDLGAAIEGSLAPEAIAQAIRKHSPDRPTLVFCPTVKSAMVVEDAIRLEGFATGIVYGDMPADLRKATLDDFRAGRVQVLVNCMVLTEGTDLPMACTCVIARATTHVGLYIQMAGRVLRLFPGKDEALIVDVVGASQKHALLAPVELFGEEVKAKREKEETEDIETWEDEFQDPGAKGPAEKHTNERMGPLAHANVDLFHGSDSAWLRTYAGVWFLRAGERYIAIVPGERPGTYDVTAMHKSQKDTGRWIAEGIEDMSYAMAWAEGEVTRSETMTARKDRSWRARMPSDSQRKFAARMGLAVTPDMHAGEVEALITVRLASHRIDPKLPELHVWPNRA
jgi:superfamily II DNA or RNA helicase